MTLIGIYRKLFPKKYRSLIRVHHIGDPLEIEIPSWTIDKIIPVKFKSLPRRIRSDLKEGCYLIGWVNLNADDVHQLRISYEKVAMPPDPNDGLA